MHYWIRVFNRQAIIKVDKKDLFNAITESHYSTLCRQYDLDPDLIEPALENLDINIADLGDSPFLSLNYRSGGARPIMVYRWRTDQSIGKRLLEDALRECDSKGWMQTLQTTRQIIGVELAEQQLQDMGLLFGYELARWAVNQGKGLVHGLDGVWYLLNKHKAFLRAEQ